MLSFVDFIDSQCSSSIRQTENSLGQDHEDNETDRTQMYFNLINPLVN